MNEYLLGLYEKSMPHSLSIPEKLSEAKAAGYDYLELSIDETDEKLARLHWSQPEISALCRAQAETGIPVKSICLSGHRRFPLGHPEEEVRAQGLAIMQEAIALAARLGVRIIQLAGYDVYYCASSPQTRELFCQGLEQAVRWAAREGVILAFETMETEFMNTVHKSMEWVERLTSPYLQVYPDIGNITNAFLNSTVAVQEDLRSGLGHLAAVHLKETSPGVFREVPYGKGHVDFSAAVSTALSLGVRMFVAEFWHTGDENWRTILQENNQFLRSRFNVPNTAG